MKKKVIIFCVNFNSYDFLNEYLSSIAKAYSKVTNQLELQVVVSDNSTDKETVDANYPYKLIIINTGSNLGYFGGIECGIRNCNVSLAEFDFIIVSNVDLKLTEDFFEKLYCCVVSEDLGCVAPCIYSESERRDRNPKILSRPGRKKLILQRTLYQFPFLDYLYTHILYAKRRQKLRNYPAGYIYAAHGSFIVFTKFFAGFLQTMNYPCFLFGEEIFLAENLIRQSLKTYYDPRLKVYDSDHVSTGKMKSKAYYWYNYKSIDILLKEYFNE